MFRDSLLFVLAAAGITLMWVGVAAVVYGVLAGFGFVEFIR